MTPKPQLHVSALNMLSRCGEMYRRRYINGEIIPPGVAAIVGTATDKAVTLDLGHKIEHKVLLEDAAVMDAASDAFKEEWNKGVLLSEEERLESLDKIKGESADKAVRLARLHHTILAPDLHPRFVQRPWVIELEGYPVDLAGTIDVQELRGDEIIVRDTKTAGKTPSQSVAHESEQLTAYALAVNTIDGKLPKYLSLDYLIDLKVPVLKNFHTERSDIDFDPFMRRVEAAVEATQKGAFIPARQDDWWCSAKWCGYHQTCPYTRKPVSISLTTINGKS